MQAIKQKISHTLFIVLLAATVALGFASLSLASPVSEVAAASISLSLEDVQQRFAEGGYQVASGGGGGGAGTCC